MPRLLLPLRTKTIAETKSRDATLARIVAEAVAQQTKSIVDAFSKQKAEETQSLTEAFQR